MKMMLDVDMVENLVVEFEVMVDMRLMFWRMGMSVCIVMVMMKLNRMVY